MSILRTNIIFLTLFIILVSSGCRKKDDIVSLKEVIVEETFMKMYPEGADEFFENMVRQEIDEKAKTVAEQLEGAISIWNSPNISSEEYYESAMVIVQNIELGKEQFLTFGNILKALGPPTSIIEREYVFEIDNNIDPSLTRIEIQYKSDKVKLLFTVSGFLDSILFHKESSLQNAWTGSGPIHWPQGYKYSKKLPIISGLFISPQSSQNLTDSVKKMLSSHSEINWLDFMLYSEPLKEVEKLNKESSTKVTVILVDGVTEKLAKVYFKIVNTQKLYCDTWWSQAGGKWQMISFERAKQIIKE